MEISKKKSHWILFGIILLGLALRVWGIDFGLPNLARPDENHISQSVVYNLVGSFLSGNPSLDPHFFYYPSFFLYVVGFFYGLYFLLGYWLGFFPDGQSFISLYQTDWTSFHLIQRYVSALFGVASIPAIYALARQLSNSRQIALASAFLLAIAYLHVRDSHFGVTDITSVFWVILCLYHIVRYIHHDKLCNIYKAAVFAGLAATTKYPSGFVFISVLTGYVLQCRYYSSSWVETIRNLCVKPSQLKPIIIIFISFIGVFFLITPFILLNPLEFLNNMQVQGGSLYSGLLDAISPGWLYHVQFSLWYGIGPFYFLIGLIGLLWCLYRKQTFKESIPHWMVMAFCGSYYVANAFTHYVFARYTMPLIPILAIYAIILIVGFGQWLTKLELIHRYVPPKLVSRVAFLLLFAAITFPNISRSIAIDSVFQKKDTRTLARKWLITHLKPGEGVGIGIVIAHVDLPPLYKRYFLKPPSDGYDYKKSLTHFYYDPKARLLDVSTNRNEYNLSTYSDVDFLRRHGIRYVVLGQVIQPMYAIPQFEIEAVKKQKGLKRVVSFHASLPGKKCSKSEDYDAIDGFFVPYTNPALVTRPGPDIEIFEVLPKS